MHTGFYRQQNTQPVREPTKSAHKRDDEVMGTQGRGCETTNQEEDARYEGDLCLADNFACVPEVARDGIVDLRLYETPSVIL
jgi:hypothetical protein